MRFKKVTNLKTARTIHADRTETMDEFDQANILGGGRPPDEMQPSDYVVECIDYTARKNRRGQITAVVLICVVLEGIWHDVELRQWLPLYPGKPINPGTKTWDHWSLALGRKPNRREKFHPKVFVGQRFVAEVGFSSKEEDGPNFWTPIHTKKEIRQ